MHLSIITPEKILFSAEAKMVVIPGSEGDFGVLPGHAPFLSTLRPGVISVDAESDRRRIVVIGGFAEVTPDRCAVLAETAFDCTKLSSAEIQARLDELRPAAPAVEEDAGEKHQALIEAIKFVVGEPVFE